MVTEGGGEDTTAPETSAKVERRRRTRDGAYVGSATVTRRARPTTGSGVDTVEYAVGDDGAWQPYTAPVVVDQVGTHTDPLPGHRQGGQHGGGEDRRRSRSSPRRRTTRHRRRPRRP